MSNDGDPKRPARRPIRPDPRADDDGAGPVADPPVRNIPLRRPLVATPASPPSPAAASQTQPREEDARRAVAADDPKPSRRDPRADDADDDPPSRSPLRRPLAASDPKADRPRAALAPPTRPTPEPVSTGAAAPRAGGFVADLGTPFEPTPRPRAVVLPTSAPMGAPAEAKPAATAASASILDEFDLPPVSAPASSRRDAPASAPTSTPRRGPPPLDEVAARAAPPAAKVDPDDAPPSRNVPRERAQIPKKQDPIEPEAPAADPGRLFDSLPPGAPIRADADAREAPSRDAAKPKPAPAKPVATTPSGPDRTGDRADAQRLAEALAKVAELTAKLEESEKRYATILAATRGEKDRVLTPDEQKRAASATAAMSELSMLTTPSASARPKSNRWIVPIMMLLFAGLAIQGNRKPIAKSVAYLRNLPSNTQAKTTTLSIAHFVQIESALGRLPRPAKFTEWLKRHAESKSPSAWTDPWGHDYRLDARPLPLAVRSAGPDGVFETEDDVLAPIY